MSQWALRHARIEGDGDGADEEYSGDEASELSSDSPIFQPREGDQSADEQEGEVWSNVSFAKSPSPPSYDEALEEVKQRRQGMQAHRREEAGIGGGESGSGEESGGEEGRTALHQEIVSFSQCALLTEEEKMVRKRALQELEECVLEVWPRAFIRMFGSQATGLALPGSDLDVVVLGRHPAWNVKPKEGGGFTNAARRHITNALTDLCGHLEDKGVVRRCSIIPARVPIIKCALSCGNLECDLSLGASNGASAVDFVAEKVDSLPPLRPLCLVLKAFLAQRKLNEPYTGGIGGWALFNMIVCHLQEQGIQDGQDCDLGQCLQDFFHRFSGGMDFRKWALSIERGGVVPKTGPLFDHRKPCSLAIEDPQEFGKDVGTPIFNIAAVRRAFKAATRKLFDASSSSSSVSRWRLWSEVQGDSSHRSVQDARFAILNTLLCTDTALARPFSADAIAHACAGHSAPPPRAGDKRKREPSWHEGRKRPRPHKQGQAKNGPGSWNRWSRRSNKGHHNQQQQRKRGWNSSPPAPAGVQKRGKSRMSPQKRKRLKRPAKGKGSPRSP